MVSIRPEDVITRDIEAGTDNRIETEVDDLEFLGSFYRAILKVKGNGGSELMADFSINLVRDMGVKEGMSMNVCLPADRLRVYAGEGSGDE